MSYRYIRYSTKTFADVWPSLADFSAAWADYLNAVAPVSGSPFIDSDEEAIPQVYYLLYARYGNNPIANDDEHQWAYKIFSVMFAYGPTWERKLGVQATLRGLTEDELMEGAKGIFNHSYNPSTAPTTDTMDELTTINEQTVNKTRRSRIDAYGALWDILRANPTEDFLRQFKPCFKVYVGYEWPTVYVEEDDEQ